MTKNFGLEILQVKCAVSHKMLMLAKEKDLAVSLVREKMARALAQALVRDKFFESYESMFTTVFQSRIFCSTEDDMRHMVKAIYEAGRAHEPCPDVFTPAYAALQADIDASKAKGPSPEEVRRVAKAIGVQEYPKIPSVEDIKHADDAAYPFLASGRRVIDPAEMEPK